MRNFPITLISMTPVPGADCLVKKGFACVCMSTEKEPGSGDWYEKTMETELKLTMNGDIRLEKKENITGSILEVEPGKAYQSILGIGTSLEESTVFNLARMPAPARREVLKALFDPDQGIGLNIIRICFGTSDFTGLPWYSYDDMPEGQADPELRRFSIKKDFDHNIIPVIKEALAFNPKIKIFASPWSPPGWMKTTGKMSGGKLKPEYYETAARYYAMAVKAYEETGIPVYAFTLQNEPEVDTGNYPSCAYTWEEERDLLKAVKKEFTVGGLKTKIWILDHNFDMGLRYAGEILKDGEAGQLTDGIAFHDYNGEPSVMSELHALYPDKDIFFSERSTWGTAGAARVAEYFRNWSRSYTSWVTMLDSDRKPNNGPFPPGPTLVIQDSKNHEKYWFIPEFYILGQFSKFIQPDAKRIDSKAIALSGITAVAFLNPDNSIVCVAVNSDEQEKRFTVQCQDIQFRINLPGQTVATFKWQASLPIIPVDEG
ncbi:MAG: glycoside hydrolase family 30 protein [Spirochaetales bacterium]|nr:glycoside hydrolase family 30 protein [Spirochaetales bacterium]